ncbi:glycosyltransferase family 9 protein [Caldimonas sp. KR1-144]|uniref:glycosyltransferase family 9 protein n=1 Tax=Caldimonas sp. KR1-144 TaxID=3400911 RepID=UPI003C2F8DC2
MRPAFDAPIERIVVLRALMLGDMLCATPALRAIRHHYPKARICLVGLGWAGPWAARLDCVDEFIALPGYPGFPETPADVRALPDFLAQVQDRRFDLAIQLHGSGAIVNPLLACFGARNMIGFHDGHCWTPPTPPDSPSWLRWPERGHESLRLLALTDHLGMARQGVMPHFDLTDEDRESLAALWPGRPPERYVCVHAGAQLPSRRWWPERFAALSDALVRRGYEVVLTGGTPEVELIESVADQMEEEPIVMAGKTDLWSLAALLEGALGVVCNDTGLSHLAAALEKPSVVVSCGSDVERWAPLNRQLHRVVAADVECRPCAHRDCPIGHGCATAIEVADVLEACWFAPPRGTARRAGVRIAAAQGNALNGP